MNQNIKSVRIPTWLRYILNTLLFAAFLFLINLMVDEKIVSYSNSKVLMLIAINIILAVSLNIATGYLGQLPLGHAGFMAVGAYTSAIFMRAVNGGAIPLEYLFPVGLILGAVFNETILPAVAAIIAFAAAIAAILIALLIFRYKRCC